MTDKTILGFNMFLIGSSGSGKTTALRTLLNIPGVKNVRGIFTEPRYDVLGRETLDKLQWRYIPPATAKWKTLVETAKRINLLSDADLQKGKIEASSCQQFIDLLEACNSFEDQNGQKHGDVSTWGTDTVFFVDGLTGVSKMARALLVGHKPTLTQPDWGISMNTVQSFIDTLSMNTHCHLVFVGHVEKEPDLITGQSKTMISTLGRKLAPILPNNFGLVILARREGNKFYWDTMDSDTDLKAGLLPFNAKLDPDFKQVFKAWEEIGGRFEA